MKKKYLALLVTAVMTVGMLTGCDATVTATFSDGKEDVQAEESVSEKDALNENEEEASEKLAPVTILYTNDIHTYVNNTADEDDDEASALTYASIAALKSDLIANGENVLLVDAGDHAQGTIYGGVDDGATIQELMKEAGYDLATIGNHEFDYGQLRGLDIIENSPTPYVCANFYSVETGENVLPSYKVFDCGGTKVAFVGIATPQTITSAAPASFQNEKGEFVYQINAGEDGKELYDAVQKAIDEAGAEADYVIALGHCGVDYGSTPYRSTDIIANVSGLTAFIDGHSHTVMTGDMVADKDGNEVLLTQTGSYLSNIGKMTIADGKVTTELISEYEGQDETVAATMAGLFEKVEKKFSEKIATSAIDFYINNAQNPDERLVRRQETNMADLVADSLYWYFNEVEMLNCDAAIQNGGGVREDIPAGEWTYFEAKEVSPFGNVACIVDVTGQQLLDCLEFGAKNVGLKNDKGKPAEFGGFVHIAGAKYEIDTSVESTVSVDENEIWQASPSGEYRVKNLQIYNKETKQYEDVDLDKKYAVGGINYLLRNCGDGMGMFEDTELIVDYVGEDYMVFAEYLKAFKPNADGVAELSTANSPLASYENYMIDYENPLGAGRIVIK